MRRKQRGKKSKEEEYSKSCERELHCPICTAQTAPVISVPGNRANYIPQHSVNRLCSHTAKDMRARQ